MDPLKLCLYFHYLTPPFYFPKRQSTKTFLLSIFREHSKKVKAINYIFCNDAYLLGLNREHLHHDYFTDILTFELSGKQDAVLADVYISVTRAKDNAQHYQVSQRDEIFRLLIHGTLHLCGYKDKTKTQREQMTKLENHYLYKFKLFHVKQTKAF